MNILVTYFSQSGNTRKVAEAIYEAIPFQKELKQVSDINDVNPYDLLFVGFPIQVFGPADQGKEFLNTYCQNKQVALFITHAVPDNFEDLPLWIDRCKEPIPEVNVIRILSVSVVPLSPSLSLLLLLYFKCEGEGRAKKRWH